MAATEGYAAPETLQVFSHARDLLGGGGTLTEQMTVVWGAYLAHSTRAEHTAALKAARQCLALAAHHEKPLHISAFVVIDTTVQPKAVMFPTVWG